MFADGLRHAHALPLNGHTRSDPILATGQAIYRQAHRPAALTGYRYETRCGSTTNANGLDRSSRGAALAGGLADSRTAISMDCKGAGLEQKNVFVELL